jgi:predicted metal-dependent phosphoesterase TrpH
MAHVDLHLHTTHSDGTLTPTELVAEAAARGVTLIAVTDHDAVSGITEAQQAARGVTVISGVEINTEVGREDVHILGYGFPPDDPALLAGLAELRAARVARMDAMLGRLATLGKPVARDRVLAIAGTGSVGRPHLAQALLEAGHVRNLAEAFDKLIGNRGPAYVPRTPFAPEAAVALIHAAGGIAGLAHPGKLGDPLRFIRRLRDAGLDALEVYHSDHGPAVTARMARYAGEYGLLPTGGSDSHGPHGARPVTIGSVPVPDAVGEALLARLGR